MGFLGVDFLVFGADLEESLGVRGVGAGLG